METVRVWLLFWCLCISIYCVKCDTLNNEVENIETTSEISSNGYFFDTYMNRNSCPLRNGLFTLKLNGLEPFQMVCDTKVAGPGWIVIMRRENGNTNFFRDWKQYRQGFGNLFSEFFIGLEKLHAITSDSPHELYIYLEDFDGNNRYAKYDEFLIGSEATKYKMEKLGSYSGNAGDALTYGLNMPFSTYDNDNDSNNWGHNCAAMRVSAGWFNSCTQTNLFGLYLKGVFSDQLDWRGLWWETWRGDKYSLKTVQMMIKRV